MPQNENAFNTDYRNSLAKKSFKNIKGYLVRETAQHYAGLFRRVYKITEKVNLVIRNQDLNL